MKLRSFLKNSTLGNSLIYPAFDLLNLMINPLMKKRILV